LKNGVEIAKFFINERHFNTCITDCHTHQDDIYEKNNCFNPDNYELHLVVYDNSAGEWKFDVIPSYISK
jgi:hypothetical protein